MIAPFSKVHVPQLYDAFAEIPLIGTLSSAARLIQNIVKLACNVLKYAFVVDKIKTREGMKFSLGELSLSLKEIIPFVGNVYAYKFNKSRSLINRANRLEELKFMSTDELKVEYDKLGSKVSLNETELYLHFYIGNILASVNSKNEFEIEESMTLIELNSRHQHFLLHKFEGQNQEKARKLAFVILLREQELQKISQMSPRAREELEKVLISKEKSQPSGCERDLLDELRKRKELSKV